MDGEVHPLRIQDVEKQRGLREEEAFVVASEEDRGKGWRGCPAVRAGAGGGERAARECETDTTLITQLCFSFVFYFFFFTIKTLQPSGMEMF